MTIKDKQHCQPFRINVPSNFLKCAQKISLVQLIYMWSDVYEIYTTTFLEETSLCTCAQLRVNIAQNIQQIRSTYSSTRSILNSFPMIVLSIYNWYYSLMSAIFFPC